MSSLLVALWCLQRWCCVNINLYYSVVKPWRDGVLWQVKPAVAVYTRYTLWLTVASNAHATWSLSTDSRFFLWTLTVKCSDVGDGFNYSQLQPSMWQWKHWMTGLEALLYFDTSQWRRSLILCVYWLVCVYCAHRDWQRLISTVCLFTSVH